MKKTLIALFFVLTCATLTMAQEKAAPAKVGVNYGKAVDKKNTILVKSLESNLSSKDSFSGKVVGTVSQVCKMSGCYLVLNSESNKEPIVVRFADTYTVPQDLVGRQVIVDGTAKARNKTDKDNANKTSRAITFIADGVLVIK